MLKSQLIELLQKSIDQSGDEFISTRDFIHIKHGGESRELAEYDARGEIVRNIVRAKRDLKEPMDSDFFRDIWPKALEVLKNK